MKLLTWVEVYIIIVKIKDVILKLLQPTYSKIKQLLEVGVYILVNKEWKSQMM